jgi:uncharacterized membrane protein
VAAAEAAAGAGSAELDSFEPGWIEAIVAFLPALVVLFVAVVRFGPDDPVEYDREYEESPPTDSRPALVGPLLHRSLTPRSDEFTATLFDLVHRRYFKARALPNSNDLELSPGNSDFSLAEFELPVARILESVLDGGPIRLSSLRERLVEHPENVVRFDLFRQEVGRAIEARGWYTFTAARVLFLSSVGLFGAGMILGWPAYAISTSAAAYLGIATFTSAMLLFHASWIAKLVRWRRRSQTGRLEYERWRAFCRYLEDFPRLKDAPAATAALWESYLVYAIAAGIAQRVLAGADVYRLEELSGSPIFWLGLNAPPDVYSGLGERLDHAGGGTRRFLPRR